MPTQLEMALLNLVTNALDAMPGGGSLSISGTADADRIRLEVSDTGPGLPAQVLDHLFDPWVTTKPKGQGSRTRARHRARGRPDARRIDFGTQSVSRCGVRHRASAPERSRDILLDRHMPRILLVDDDPETCTFLEELLDAPGSAVRVGAGPEHGAGEDASAIRSICSSPTST